jgi:serine/threonine protein phosphatase PrpC
MTRPTCERPDAENVARLRVEAAGTTDVGRHRAVNEDSFVVAPGVGLYAVADGVGGRPAGHLASRLAVEQVLKGVADEIGDHADHSGGAALRRRLVSAIEHANQAILSSPERPQGGMATTLAGVLVDGVAYCIAHVGDSRIYRLRDDVLELLTSDHTVVNEAIWRGEPVERALARPDRSAITRALGVSRQPKVTARLGRAAPGDLLLLCTDGLHRMVSDAEIERILLDADHVAHGVNQLVQRANENGGKDNVTVVALRWETRSDHSRCHPRQQAHHQGDGS